MNERSIDNFRERACEYFEPFLTREGYSAGDSQALAFLIAKVLEDALPLIENINNSESNSDTVLDNIHMLYANKKAFLEAEELLFLRK